MSPRPEFAVMPTPSPRRVVVCGGSKGIGRAIALAFAKQQASVSICARGADALATTAADIRAAGGSAHVAPCDLADGAAVRAYVTAAGTALGGIDVLVNNASGFGMSDDEAGWRAGIDVDVMATVRASQAALPFLERSQGASIINITSISAYGPSVRSAPYAAVKAAIVNYTSSQALMLAPKRIRVNAIAPGSIEFPGGTWEQRKTTSPQLYQAILKSIPFGRLGEPEEIADVAVFLASDAARWMTGQTLTVDGGQTLS
jgi:3-oxoacyl-[acyl-carrier protein] reductase